MDTPGFGALFTDLYELTMAYGHWRLGRADDQGIFHLYFRNAPFGGRFAVAAGLETALDHLASIRFTDDELGYLGGLTGNDGLPLFDEDFLRYLDETPIRLDVSAVPEGTVVFPGTPLVRVEGPLPHCLLVETALLNTINFQTLIATKAARVCQAAGWEPVLDFGLRRAQGPDGGLSASRAAFIGGCVGTSNVAAGRRSGIPVKGTHAHAWVMAFGDELAAFEAYAEAMPNNCVFLVDTYDTLEGVRNAVQVGRRLRAGGHEMLGIRLDSGDLAELSIAARRILDQAGFPDAHIVASNDLDEYAIADLKRRGAKIALWGVGTRLVTGHDQAALGGVYKLAAVRPADGRWEPRLKRSDDAAKASIPGRLQVRRYSRDDAPCADMIWDEFASRPSPTPTMVSAADPPRRQTLAADLAASDLLVPVMRGGRRVDEHPPLAEIRVRSLAQVLALPASIRRHDDPAVYEVGLEAGLHARRAALLQQIPSTGFTS